MRTSRKIGVWFVGARGDIAATALVGARALARGLVPETGLTTALPPFDRLGLSDLADLRFGGVDLDDRPLRDCALRLYERSRTVSRELLDAVSEDLDRIEADIIQDARLSWDPANPASGLPGLRELVSGLRATLRAFRDKHGLSHVVVVTLMSAAPEPAPSPLRDSVEGVNRLIDADRKDLVSPSVCYAYAAMEEGCSYVDFTTNSGTDWKGIAELAERRRIPFYGNDGKTGETLVKTALAHMFAYRNLRVLSWEGVNMLGNNDGRALDDPRNKQTKLRHKEAVLDDILGYRPHAGVTINYVPSIGDWKTAWDLIHFQGFLDVPMTMQFTWQGCDSILAAPLVLDLVRLSEFASRHRESGPMRHLAAFFKSPVGVQEMDFHHQFQMLFDYAQGHLAATDKKSACA